MGIDYDAGVGDRVGVGAEGCENVAVGIGVGSS